jgi:hypothetical protein
VDGTGRQQYHRVQVVQLRLWVLELVRTVWRMPAYRRAPRPRTALHAPPVGLFDEFATCHVHIRGHHARAYHAVVDSTCLADRPRSVCPYVAPLMRFLPFLNRSVIPGPYDR